VKNTFCNGSTDMLRLQILPTPSSVVRTASQVWLPEPEILRKHGLPIGPAYSPSIVRFKTSDWVSSPKVQRTSREDTPAAYDAGTTWSRRQNLRATRDVQDCSWTPDKQKAPFVSESVAKVLIVRVQDPLAGQVGGGMLGCSMTRRMR
jgi:hypothetical protein